VEVDNYFKVRFGYYKTIDEATACLEQLKGKMVDGFIGITDNLKKP